MWDTAKKEFRFALCGSVTEPDATREYPSTLAQGVRNHAHVLELLSNGDGPVPVAAFRVYKPPLP